MSESYKLPIYKIGIVVTNPIAEKKKDEIINCNSSLRPWLKNVEPRHSIMHNGKRYVADDVSMGYYLLYNYANVQVNFIKANEISLEKFNENDLVFFLIYDLLESYHIDDMKTFQKFENTLKKAKNIFPPYSYQKFINNKCNYYTHLDKNKISVAANFCIENIKEIELKTTKDPLVRRVMKKIKQKNWGEAFVAKPVLGQESKSFQKFDKIDEADLYKYLDKTVKHYPGIIFQEYVEGFDKGIIETRTMWVGDEYQYSIMTTSESAWVPKEEGGTRIHGNLDKVKKFAKKVLKNLPEIKIKGVNVPRFLTRIDIGCCLKGKHKYFVNEVEFVPSLYIDMKNSALIDMKLAEQIIEIVKVFKKKDNNILYINKFRKNIPKEIVPKLKVLFNECFYKVDKKKIEKMEGFTWYTVNDIKNMIIALAILDHKKGILWSLCVSDKYSKYKFSISEKLIHRVLYDTCNMNKDKGRGTQLTTFFDKMTEKNDEKSSKFFKKMNFKLSDFSDSILKAVYVGKKLCHNL